MTKILINEHSNLTRLLSNEFEFVENKQLVDVSDIGLIFQNEDDIPNIQKYNKYTLIILKNREKMMKNLIKK